MQKYLKQALLATALIAPTGTFFAHAEEPIKAAFTVNVKGVEAKYIAGFQLENNVYPCTGNVCTVSSKNLTPGDLSMSLHLKDASPQDIYPGRTTCSGTINNYKTWPCVLRSGQVTPTLITQAKRAEVTIEPQNCTCWISLQ